MSGGLNLVAFHILRDGDYGDRDQPMLPGMKQRALG